MGIKEVSTSLVTFTFSYIQVEQNLQLCYITYPWKRMNACKSPSLCVAGAPSESWCGAPLCSGERENLCGQLIGYKLLRSGEGSFYGNKLFMFFSLFLPSAKLGFVLGAFRSRNVGSRLVETAEVRASAVGALAILFRVCRCWKQTNNSKQKPNCPATELLRALPKTAKYPINEGSSPSRNFNEECWCEAAVHTMKCTLLPSP